MKAWVPSFRWETWILSWSYHVVNKVCTHYLDSTFIGLAWHQDLFEHFISVLDSSDLKKVLQVSMDGVNVNWAFFQNYTTIGQKMTWVSYFQLDHAVSMLFMELSKLESRAEMGNSKKFWEPCIKFCMTRQLGNMITLMWLEVVDSLFPSVAHSGSKMNR